MLFSSAWEEIFFFARTKNIFVFALTKVKNNQLT